MRNDSRDDAAHDSGTGSDKDARTAHGARHGPRNDAAQESRNGSRNDAAQDARDGPRNDAGSATAETAVALPALVLALALCVWAFAVVAATLRCADAARAAARTAARNESAEAVADAARRAAGPAAVTELTGNGDLVTVRVTLRVQPPPGILGHLVPAITVQQASTAHVEPDAGVP
jgi:hypothetical protein